MLTALTRSVGSSIVRCELEYLPRVPIDGAEAAREHLNYETVLRSLGLHIITLFPDEKFPDGLFVEDAAIVLEELAILCRAGALSRRGESASIAAALAPFRKLEWAKEPATIEGGDVMRLGKTLYCGISRRTNPEGARQLSDLTQNFGYAVIPVAVHGCLHLKSAICPLSDEAVLANRQWIDMTPFHDLKIYDVPEEEPAAANILRIGRKIILPDSFPRTREMLERHGFPTIPIDICELQKAEAGVTCSSLIFST